MSGISKFAALVFGTAMVVLGVFIMLSDSVSLPTRQQLHELQFSGFSLFFLGLSPLSAGLLSLALTFGYLHRESRYTQTGIIISIAALILSLVLANIAS